MKKKKIIAIISILSLIIGLKGCTSSVKLPEGDVKIVNQQVQGVVELLLQSTDYGKDKSTVSSLVVPKDSKYNVSLFNEKYINGELKETKEIANYSTETIEKDSIIHIILNTGKLTDNEEEKSIYSIAEIDKENTKDSKNPEYKLTKYYGEALNFDSKSSLSQIGTNLDEEVAIVGLVKFKEDDTEKVAINLESYKDEVGNYSEVNIFKIKVSK